MKSNITIIRIFFVFLIYFTASGYTHSQSITVLYPAGGENWRVGSLTNIVWASTGITSVDISYFDGTSWSVLFSDYSSPDGDHNIAWNPVSPTVTGRIKITEHTLGTIQFISSVFSIITPKHLHVPSDYSSIEAALGAANDGDFIDVANGIYYITSTMYINHEITIKGASESGVYINVSSISDGNGITINKSNTTITNFTLIPNSTDGGYPIHVTGSPFLYNLVFDHITVDGAIKTPFDFNGVTYMTLQNLIISNTSQGNGISLAGCIDVNANHITTRGNGWGGLAIYISISKLIASQYITVDGTSSTFNESNKVYYQDQLGFVNTHLTVLGFDYFLRYVSDPGYTFYQIDKSAAYYAAVHSPFAASSSSVFQISTGQYWVKDSMNIQPAISDAPDGSLINVTQGNYAYNLTISKNISLIGTNAVISPLSNNVISVMGAALNNVVIHGFNIVAPNSNLAIANTSGDIIDASNNSWGAISNRGVITHLISGLVNFAPWTGMLTGVPNLISPVGNTKLFTITPTLQYSLPFTVTGTPNYTIYLSTDPGTYAVHLGDTSSTSFNVPNGILLGGGHYFWNVCYSLNGQYSDFAAEQSFTIDNSLSGIPPAAIPVWPINNAAVASNNPSLQWYFPGSYVGPVTYDIWLFDSTNNSVPVFTADKISSTSVNVSTNLTTGHSYYWIILSHGNLGISTYSDTARFRYDSTMAGTPPVPIPSWPKTNVTLFGTSPYLGWYTNSILDTALTFDVVISDTRSEPPVWFQNGLTSTNVPVPSGYLISGHSYLWKVQSHLNGITSGYSPSAVFNVSDDQGGVPPIPVPVWPANYISIYSSTPQLQWHPGSVWNGAAGYEIEVYDTTSPGVLVFDGSFSACSAKVTPGLLAGHTYQWHVKSVGSGGASGFSYYAFFSVDNSLGGVPSKPVPSWPVNNIALFTTTPKLEWQQGAMYNLPVTYDFVVFDNLDLLHPVFTATGISSESALITAPLLPGKDYSWQVQTHSGQLVSGYSDLVTFNTYGIQSGNPRPFASWPVDGTDLSDLQPLLQWYIMGTPVGTVTYEIEMKPISVPFDASGTIITSNSCQSYHYTSGLTPGQVYHWRVRTLSSSASPSAWSDEISTGGARFTEAANAFNVVSPLVGSPTDGVYIPVGSIWISWYITSPTAVFQSYKLEVSKSSDISNPVVVFYNVFVTYKLINSLDNGTYYWRVTALSLDGKSSGLSNIGFFHIGTPVSVTNETNFVPSHFEVFQNYPNPFNPSTSIKYGLHSATDVIIKVYNLLGQEVKTLVNEYRNAGTFLVKWDGDNNYGNKVSSGVYIFRVTAGNNNATMKMILLK